MSFLIESLWIIRGSPVASLKYFIVFCYSLIPFAFKNMGSLIYHDAGCRLIGDLWKMNGSEFANGSVDVALLEENPFSD